MLDSLLPGRSPQTNIMPGTFNDNISSVSDEVFIVVPTFDENQKFGPCRWMPRVDDDGVTVLPQRGDPALLVITDNNDPWVVAWWPY